MKQCMERLYNGLIKENPTFVLMLGMCPTLAVTTSAINGLGMGLSTMVVLALSNFLISALRKVIPDKVRIPAYIVIIATFVTLVELLLHAYIPVLHESLGIYISLIVVNCIILGRAEAYASKNKILPSLFDGIGMGLGFTMALTLIGLVREFLGAGTLFGFSGADLYGTPLPELLIGLVDRWLDPNSSNETVRFFHKLLTDEIASFTPMGIIILAPGAFFVLAVLTAIQNVMKERGKAKGKDVSKIQSGCNSDCMNCSDSGCAKRLIEPEELDSESGCETEQSEEMNKTEIIEGVECSELVVEAADEESEDTTDEIKAETEESCEENGTAETTDEVKIEETFDDTPVKLSEVTEPATEEAKTVTEVKNERIKESAEDFDIPDFDDLFDDENPGEEEAADE